MVNNRDWREWHEKFMRRHKEAMRGYEIREHERDLRERLRSQEREDSWLFWTKEERKFDRKARRAEAQHRGRYGRISAGTDRKNLKRWADGNAWELGRIADMDHKEKAAVRKRLEMARKMIALANDMLTLPADYAGVSAQLEEAAAQIVAAGKIVDAERDAQQGLNGAAMRRLMDRISDLGYRVSQDFAGNDEFWIVRADERGDEEDSDLSLEAAQARAAVVERGAEIIKRGEMDGEA